MLLLTGNNLGERQRELNTTVIEAADKKLDLNELKSNEHSDIDKLFLIDLASRYENIEFIVDMLRSGDSLYVTRAMQCAWIYDDKYSDIMCPSHLHHNIFPHMSLKMKKKMLGTISSYIRNEDRLVCFYSYCMNFKFINLALKFLMYTSETFKLDLVKYDNYFWSYDASKNLKYFIGNSIPLATAYVEMHSAEDRPNVIHQIRFLYSEFQESYIDMVEKYAQVDASYPNSIRRLGIRISRDILKMYKTRLWNNIVLYINFLNKSMLVKYLTSGDVKKIAQLLLPSTAASFWSADFYHSYKFILDLIPSTEIFAYLKDIFCLKYENELYEMNINFYNLKHYKMLTAEEQEAWALRHIERGLELFGSGNDYIWYKFVGFDKAIEGIKQYVSITPDNDKRTEIVSTLVHSAKSHEDLQKLLHYYYDRHVNESDEHKMSFIDLIISTHDVYGFNTECWAPFNKLLCSLKEYNARIFDKHWKLKEYCLISMIYHILNAIEFSEDLQYFIAQERVFHWYYNIIKQLSPERSHLVIKYWLNFRADRIKVLLEKPSDDKVKEEIVDEIYLNWLIIWIYDRDYKECPDIVLAYMKSNLEIYQDHPAFKKQFEPMNEKDFFRLLKTDLQKAIESVSKVECNSYRWSFRLNRFFRTLKVYFSHDVSKIYLKYFLDLLELLKGYPRYNRIYRNIKIAVVGVLQLGSEEQKEYLLEKYTPLNPKIDRQSMDQFVLQVQKAICRLAFQSRPPVQLSSIQKFIIGDYVRLCLPIFDNFFVNLPQSRVMDFIHSIIDSPVSIQKHGIRLAFKCFSSKDLAEVILKIWKRTKNVSLRLILYKSLFKRVLDEDYDSQKALYEVLKFFTSELNHQDHEDLFDLIISDDMPDEYKGDYIEIAWKTISEFSDKKANLIRKTNVINHMVRNIRLVNRDFMRKYIIDDHVLIFYGNQLKFNCNTEELEGLIKAKWDLIAAFIVTGNAKSKIILDSNLKLATDILTKVMEMWGHNYKGVYVYRQLCNSFLNTFHKESYKYRGRYVNVIPVYRCVLRILQEYLWIEELYLPQWKFILSIKSSKALHEYYTAQGSFIDCNYPNVVEIAYNFAKKVCKVIRKLVDSKEFYHSFYTEMADALYDVCKTTGAVLGTSQSGFTILFCGHLAVSKIREAHVLAVMVMPKKPPQNWENRHENALQRIKQYSCEEAQCRLYQKFAPVPISA